MVALLSLCCFGLSALKVLRSLRNNTQQPVIYFVEGKNVVAPVPAHLGEDRHSWSLPITRTSPAKQHTCLQNYV